MTSTSRLSQEDAARIMFAHNAEVDARGYYMGLDERGSGLVEARLKWQAARQAFSELVAQLTDSEGL